MVIDTTSREGMESSLAHLMGVSVPELYQYIEAAADSAVEGQWCFNQDLFDKAMEDFYSDMIEQELPDEILLFHLSRRLKGSENEISYNLQELLTSNNSFSEFLNAHQITFRKGAGNRIILCYRDRQISLENTMSTDVCYLRSRLGYNSGREDFCFNGFAFRDLLMKNQYTRQLQDCPEILERLESYLRIKGLAKEYAEKSEYYSLSVNSFYIIDDAKQRDKMTEEFYSAVKKEIALYQEKADYLIQSGSRSPSVMERWVNKIATLEQKKQHYEEILRRELDGLDDEFETLRLLSQELSVRATGLRFRKAA